MGKRPWNPENGPPNWTKLKWPIWCFFSLGKINRLGNKPGGLFLPLMEPGKTKVECPVGKTPGQKVGILEPGIIWAQKVQTRKIKVTRAAHRPNLICHFGPGGKMGPQNENQAQS